MRRFQQTGDGEAFAALYESNASRIERLVASCLRYGAADLDAAEIVQDVFVSVFRFARCFRPEAGGAFRRWSAEIARNAVRRALRDRARRHARLRGAVYLEETPAAPARLEEREEERSIRDAYPVFLGAYAVAFSQLAPRDREILHEVEVEQRPYAEVSERHGVRVGAVKMIVFRARRRLLDRVASLLSGAHRAWAPRTGR